VHKNVLAELLEAMAAMIHAVPQGVSMFISHYFMCSNLENILITTLNLLGDSEQMSKLVLSKVSQRKRDYCSDCSSRMQRLRTQARLWGDFP
jgi:hypothetical protein